jgi:DNA-binding Xre family transcriptional regulator
MRQIDLAEKFGIAQYTVSCIKRGMTWTHVTGKVFYRRKLTREQAIEIFQSDLPAKELAIQYGVTASNISTIKSGKTFNLLKEFGKPESVDLKGSNYYLGREKIVEIFKSEGGVNDIARRFEVSPCTVSLIKNGKRWAEVTKNI